MNKLLESRVVRGPSALGRVRPPGYVGQAAQGLLIALVALALGLAVIPWQQSALGTGMVQALDPAARPQVVASPVTGMVLKWHVQEGDRVQAGDVLVTLRDNDPSFLDRLQRELDTVDDQIDAAEASLVAYESKVDAAEASLEATVASAMAKVKAAERRVESAEQRHAMAVADEETAELNLARIEPLFEEGLVSQRQLELTVLKSRETKARTLEMLAALASAKADLASARAVLVKDREEGRAKLESARADLLGADQKLSNLRARRLGVETSLARQGAQRVVAPRDGTVLRIYKGQGGEQAKQGDLLARIVPDDTRHMVELMVQGIDAPLIQPGQHVRLQFEGWPALQFAGWPSVAIGTFPGEVMFIDAADDGQGRFRIVVREPDEGDVEWPEKTYLRQGVKAKGWVLLKQVPLGWELWRQLNGFQPTVDSPEAESELKAPKVLVPKDK
ncbi:MAG: HlyD family efflux transporter periplasmic adaptor subunit [Deltaproteobacteria bacterium]|nr:MAG: HlyD family efflux transporter periplasmic adaptor subunit [Deltaproteobacteria bacterium]